MHVKQKSIWIVSREYAGIAEAGGVKNVTTSLAETLIKYGFDVKVFIPQYGCYETNCLQKYTSLESFYANISITDELYTVTYAQAESESESVPIVFVKNHIFSSKNAVYTYT
ncbi:MAG TPA: glycogen/starch synthase, partial [Treponemataceae bacterium]|nr:glycogen/starch synthase [Treponemataceae bacterium]